ncbi:MAG: ABC transporter permease [Anaerolineae bacterium]|jgi:oligopeptide transport system permease protein|nr:ABC transporter permease [Anaerolineae bacterium]
MAVAEGAEPISLEEEQKGSNPWVDAWRLFRRNKASLVALVIICAIFFIAISAKFWTSVGLLDERSGTGSRHSINPANQARVDPYPDPGSCARDDQVRSPYWCGWLDDDMLATVKDSYCSYPEPDADQQQWCYMLGADSQGKDWLSQTVYGAQVSLAVGVVGSTMSLIVGLIYGLVSGFYGGRIDNIMMRIIDFMYGIPYLVMVILFQVFFTEIAREYQDSGREGFVGFILQINKDMGGLLFLFVALGLLSWIGMARLARGQVLAYREKEFVEAARALGASNRRIIFVHLLPNIIGPLIVAETLAIPGYIFTEAFLSFIGLGVQPGTPSWGAMISEVRTRGGFFSNRHILLVPSIALVITTLAFNFLGDGLRDALDPRLRGT